jgi:hypothetical protein
MHPRRFARVRPSGQVSRVAKIIVDQKAPVIDCSIHQKALPAGLEGRAPHRRSILRWVNVPLATVA